MSAPPAAAEPQGRVGAADACVARAAARLGHALRNPLTTIKAGAQLARRLSPPDAPAAALLASIQEEAEAIERLARGLETLVALQPAALEAFALEPLVARAFDELRAAAAARQVELSTAGLRGRRVRGAPGLIETALRELLDNAIRYSAPGSRVEVRGRKRGDEVVLEVSDGSGGLAVRAEQRLFEPFVSTSGRAGLGLCRARRAALLAGGEVALGRNSETGCRFELVLPGSEE